MSKLLSPLRLRTQLIVVLAMLLSTVVGLALILMAGLYDMHRSTDLAGQNTFSGSGYISELSGLARQFRSPEAKLVLETDEAKIATIGTTLGKFVAEYAPGSR